MKSVFAVIVLCGFCVLGCESEPEVVTGSPTRGNPALQGGAPPMESVPAGAPIVTVPPPDHGAPNAAAPTEGTSVALTADNTTVKFVGVHAGDKPDPRTGTFGKLTGTAIVNEGVLKSLTVEFDTSTVSTDIDKLTDHLKSPDFFDVKQHPTAKFESTAIEMGDNGSATITGNLTLLGVTKPVSFPATVSTDGGFTVSGELSIDRTEFGMNYSTDKVEKMVTLTFSVGE